jgi:hypothetical protein
LPHRFFTETWRSVKWFWKYFCWKMCDLDPKCYFLCKKLWQVLLSRKPPIIAENLWKSPKNKILILWANLRVMNYCATGL